jgi:molybdopterin/thiamine biosynthesis adenylyltransferase
MITPEQPLQPVLPDNASIKVIGLGGVGGIVTRYGCMFCASLRRTVRWVMVDGDSFEDSNATRMFFSSHGNKAAVLREELLPRFADSTLSLIAIEAYVSKKNIARLIREGDIVLLTVDNHATRKLVNDHCAKLKNICLISGGNDGVGKDSTGRTLRGTYGNAQIFVRRNGKDLTPSLARYHPEIAKPADHLPTDQSCTELVASVPQIVFANLTAATAILNTLYLHLCGALPYAELAFDIAEGVMRPVLDVTEL